jgi:dinuclear metal center YbgI/SA1388 family protein
MQLAKILESLENIAPTARAETWDNVGLLTGDPRQEITQILLTIDYTSAVADEARQTNCNLIVAYHPPIFQPLKRIAAGSLIFEAIRNGVAIFSPHTALDVAEGGTNDMLADAIGLADVQPLKTVAAPASQYKLVVFVPAEQLERVSTAIFEVGAGRIGKYSSCSFRAAGTGTFFGEEGTKPAVGRSGRLEQTDEIRLETVVPIGKVQSVIQALRESHPYEEPAFDLNLLAADPTGRGQGRVGSLPHTPRSEVFGRIKRELGLSHLLIAGPTEGVITRAAVCAGACGDLLDSAMSAGAQLYLTGEMRHHDAIKAAAAGVTVVCTLHSNSERAVLRRIKKRLEQTSGIPPIAISSADRDPFTIQ